MQQKNKIYFVDTVSIFRMRYAIRAESAEKAREKFNELDKSESITEFSQKHLGEKVSDIREVNQKQYLLDFDTDNAYLKSWSKQKKLDFINQ